MPSYHTPVMLDEATGHLRCRPGKIIVDGTLGGAGHFRRICELIAPDGLPIGMDQDHDAIEHANKIQESLPCKGLIFHDSFINLDSILSSLNIGAVDGILLDLGLSRHQIFESRRGFSFMRDEPLDMRMDTDQELSAKEIVNEFQEEELVKILKEYGEEPMSRAIARRIVEKRRLSPIRTSGQLAKIVSEVVRKKKRSPQRIHPATRVFMALRIAVNDELKALDRFMENAGRLLADRGRLCVISFHSLEDRIVKRRMKEMASSCSCPPTMPVCRCGKESLGVIITKKPIIPSREEIMSNPLARSAKLRVFERRAG